MRSRELQVVAYYNGGYPVRGMQSRELQVPAYYNGGYPVRCMRPRGSLVVVHLGVVGTSASSLEE